MDVMGRYVPILIALALALAAALLLPVPAETATVWRGGGLPPLPQLPTLAWGRPAPVVRVPTHQATREQIIAYALSRRGDPYVSGARAEGGSDCSGFTQLVYKRVAGIDIGATTFSQWPAWPHTDDPQPGDLWFGRWNNSGAWDSEHTGIVADVDADGRLDLIHNGADRSEVHVTYNFLDTYLGDKTLGYAVVLK